MFPNTFCSKKLSTASAEAIFRQLTSLGWHRKVVKVQSSLGPFHHQPFPKPQNAAPQDLFRCKSRIRGCKATADRLRQERNQVQDEIDVLGSKYKKVKKALKSEFLLCFYTSLPIITCCRACVDCTPFHSQNQAGTQEEDSQTTRTSREKTYH